MKSFILSILFILSFTTFTLVMADPQPSDFEIVSFRAEWRYGTLRAIGEIRNNGSEPAGLQVEVIALDVNGILIDSAKFWPNSVENIPPGSSCGIEHPITQDTRAQKLEIRIISVKVW